MASPLTLLMPVIPGTSPQTIAAALAASQADIDKALTSIGTVHYARFLLLDRSTPNLQPGGSSEELVLAVITEYDGSFNDYIGDFVKQIGNVFNALLQFVVGGAAVTPVQDHTPAFMAFITANDASQHFPNNGAPAPNVPPPPGSNGLYQAYPYSVQDILAAGIPS
jgi:hypothetical protein